MADLLTQVGTLPCCYRADRALTAVIHHITDQS